MPSDSPRGPLAARLLIALLRICCALPLPLLMALGRAAAVPLAALARSRRRVVLANLQLCMPELSDDTRRALAIRNLRSTALSLLENLLAWHRPQLHDQLQLMGAEHLLAALQNGRGAILLTPHFTMIEMVPRALREASSAPEQIAERIRIVVRRHNSELLECVADSGRCRWGSTLDKKDVRGMLRALKDNAVLISAPDQNFSYGTVFAPFFGVPAATTTGNLRLASAAGCPTLPCMVRRLAGGGWQVRIDPPLADYPSNDPLADATRSNALVEAEIRQVPEQYLWAHRRFRSRPPGEAPLYDNEVLKEQHRQR